MRVAQRVAGGGHGVPSEKVTSRYPRSLENLAEALEFVPTVRLLDNSYYAEYRLLGVFKKGRLVEQSDCVIPTWARCFFASRAPSQCPDGSANGTGQPDSERVQADGGQTQKKECVAGIRDVVRVQIERVNKDVIGAVIL